MTASAVDLPRSFADAMACIGGFEPAPHLAVAVSGGSDSMALLLLAKIWAGECGGQVTALTVDHGLRPGSREESRRVASWCRERTVTHIELSWEGPKPRTGIQARARAARYALLEGWCHDAGVLHLLVAHHRDDQAETIAMRAAMKSGPEGLAGMAAIAERRDIRLLRPLLAVAKRDLQKWLRTEGQSWLEDPSNRDPRFTRSRLRMRTTALAPWTPVSSRGDRDRALAAALALIATIHPEGWVRLELAGLLKLPLQMVADLLRRVVLTVAGGAYPPRSSGLRDCAAWVVDTRVAAVRNLAGCRLSRGTIFVDFVRESAAVTQSVTSAMGGEILWDRRFRVRKRGDDPDSSARVVTAGPTGAGKGGSNAARRAAAMLPVLRGVDGGVALPHVFYGRGLPTLVSVPTFDVTFRPHLALGGAAFAGLQAAKLSSMFPVPADAIASQPHRPSKSVEPQ